jgi:hypothetical protein
MYHNQIGLLSHPFIIFLLKLLFSHLPMTQRYSLELQSFSIFLDLHILKF